jgi:DNA-binding phage protein
MGTNPIEKYVDKFTGFYTALADKILFDIKRRVSPDMDGNQIARIVNSVLDKHNVESVCRKAFLNSVVGATTTGGGISIAAQPLALKRWFLESAFSASGVPLSETTTKLLRRDVIIESVRKSLAIQRQWRMAAQDLQDTGAITGAVAKDVSGVVDVARKMSAMSNNPDLLRQYKVDVRKVQRRIDSLVDPSRSKLKGAYQDIINLTNQYSDKAAAQAMKYAVYFKERYNAERIVRTESARGYGQGFQIENQNEIDTIGWRLVLSGYHPEYDICDYYAKTDLYGMGAGVYPKGYGPPYPLHPHCTCLLEHVYDWEANHTGTNIDDKSAIRAIKNMTTDQRRKLLGVAGSKEFEASPGAWRTQVKNYQEHGPVVATVPKDVLYKKSK